MATIFGNQKETKVQEIDKISNASTNIGKGATLQGNIETFGNVRIDGKLVGDVKTKSKIATGNESVIEGSIYAQNAEIEGEVKGRVEVQEMLVLKTTAIIRGDIVAGKLVVESGAVFNGSCQMGDAAKILKEKNNNVANASSSNIIASQANK